MNSRSLLSSIAVLFLAAAPLFSQQPHRTLLLRIDNVTQKQLEEKGISPGDEYTREVVVSLVRDTAFVLATKAEAEVYRERGLSFTVVMEDTVLVRMYKRALYGQQMSLQPPYHAYSAMLKEIDSLQKARPELLQHFVIGSTSQEKRPITAVRISSNARTESDRPRILFDGCHHADELMGGEICLALVRELVGKFGSDPEITRFMTDYEIYVVPVVNVDGHNVVTSGIDPRWRKNTRDTNGDGVIHSYPDGVDPNRNYDFNWAHGGSGEPTSERYRGPFPFSESEPRAFADLARQKKFVLSVTYHSQGEVVYYPWDWKGRKAPDDALLTDIARGLAGSIRTMKGDTSYRAEYGAGLVGQSYPWLYGANGTFDFIVETGRGASFFAPHEVPGIVAANLAGIRYILRRAAGPGLTGHVTDATTGVPLEAEVWFPAIETEDVHRRMTEPGYGRFWRLLPPGKYTCIVSRPGYRTAVLSDVDVLENGWTVRDFALVREAK
jgi:Zinc carboxypeptidase/Carboxypeptidase regulatory-like domain